ASRQAGQAALAGLPVAGRRVEQHQLLAGTAQRRRDLCRGVSVGKLAFDGAEAILRGGFDTLQERQLGVHRRKVGGESRHDRTPVFETCRRYRTLIVCGSHKEIIGNATRIASRSESASTKGITPRNSSPVLTPGSSDLMTKRFIPTGG